jgi:hypothetical protein
LNCSFCGKKIGLTEKQYKFDKQRVLCLDCMTCSVCGSKADGSYRGVFALQPFCKEHYEEISTKQVDAWPDQFIKARILHLTKYKTALTERMGKDFRSTAKLGALSAVFSPYSTASLNLTMLQTMKYQSVRDAVAAVDAETAKLNEILANRSQAKPEQILPGDVLTILNLRLAKGEITEDQYKGLVKTISSIGQHPSSISGEGNGSSQTSIQKQSAVGMREENGQKPHPKGIQRLCSNCGVQIPDKAKFCVVCGKAT